MATYGGGIGFSTTITDGTTAVNGGPTVLYTHPTSGSYTWIKFHSFSLLPGSTSISSPTSINIQADNGLGGYVTQSTFSVVTTLIASQSAVIPSSGLNANQNVDGYFLLMPGMRVQVQAGTGGGGTLRTRYTLVSFSPTT